MDIASIQQIITTLGFPIACVIALGFFVWKVWQQNTNNAKEREDRLFQQIDKFSISLDNFNTTLIKIDTRLEAVEKKIDNNGK